MAEKEEPIANDDTGKIKVKAKKEKQPDGNETKGNVTKVGVKMKKKAEVMEQSMTKVDLSKPQIPKEDEVKKSNADDGGVVDGTENADATQKQEEVQPEAQAQETTVLEEITNEEKVEEVAEAVEEAVAESMQTGNPLPENIEKLVNFMEETGGDITDYVTLNQNYDDLDNHTLLKEYYKSTKSHLSEEEVDFVMEDNFAFDEDIDDERDIKRKKTSYEGASCSSKAALGKCKIQILRRHQKRI